MVKFLNVTFGETNSFRSVKFNSSGKIYKIQYNYNSSEKSYDIVEILDELYQSFGKIISETLKDYSENDFIRFSINHKELDRSIFIPFRKKKFFTPSLIINQIAKVCQSKREFIFSGDLVLSIFCVENSNVGGRIYEIDEWMTKSKRVIRVKHDGLCIARSIILSIAKHNKIDQKEWRKLISDSKNCLTRKAEEFYKNIDLEYSEKGISIESLNKIQIYLGNEYRIIAVTPPDIILYSGNNFSTKHIYLIINKNKTHADCLLSLKAFFKKNYICTFCLAAFSNKSKHKCQHRCRYCFDENVCTYIETIKCDQCNRNFISEECFEKHLKSICRERKLCGNCYNSLNKYHICGFKRCLSLALVLDRPYLRLKGIITANSRTRAHYSMAII